MRQNKNTQFEIYGLYLSCTWEMHTTWSMRNCNTAKCVHVLLEDVTEGHNIDVTRWLFDILHCFTKQKDEFVEFILRGHYIRYCGSGVGLSSLGLRPVVAVGRN